MQCKAAQILNEMLAETRQTMTDITGNFFLFECKILRILYTKYLQTTRKKNVSLLIKSVRIYVNIQAQSKSLHKKSMA